MSNVKVDVIKHKHKTELERSVIRIVGPNGIVHGGWTENEPLSNRYTVFISPAMKTGKYKKALKQGKKVTAQIKFDGFQWNVSKFWIVEPEIEVKPSKTELEDQKKEYEDLCGGY